MGQVTERRTDRQTDRQTETETQSPRLLHAVAQMNQYSCEKETNKQQLQQFKVKEDAARVITKHKADATAVL